MNVLPTKLDGVLIFEPRVFGDERGFFLETWSGARYAEHGLPQRFAQDNVSFSRRGVLRGLHFQQPYPQGKLVSVLQGSVFDVAVDLRPDSPTFGEWVGVVLSAENHRQLWIPPGFAHGFQVTSEAALFSYKCTEYYRPDADRCLRWDDPQIGVEWPITPPILSAKDEAAPRLRESVVAAGGAA
jgi:dTDP-4-dehydrorhamnose 3,5-epimerase